MRTRIRPLVRGIVCGTLIVASSMGTFSGGAAAPQQPALLGVVAGNPPSQSLTNPLTMRKDGRGWKVDAYEGDVVQLPRGSSARRIYLLVCSGESYESAFVRAQFLTSRGRPVTNRLRQTLGSTWVWGYDSDDPDEYDEDGCNMGYDSIPLDYFPGASLVRIESIAGDITGYAIVRVY